MNSILLAVYIFQLLKTTCKLKQQWACQSLRISANVFKWYYYSGNNSLDMTYWLLSWMCHRLFHDLETMQWSTAWIMTIAMLVTFVVFMGVCQASWSSRFRHYITGNRSAPRRVITHHHIWLCVVHRDPFAGNTNCRIVG